MRPLLYTFPDEQEPSQRLATALKIDMKLVETHIFPDGEHLPRVGSATPTTFLYRSLNRPNEKLIELMLVTDALRRQGADRIVLIAPYLPYMRQDAVFRLGEPLSQQVVCGMLDRSFERIVTVDPHLHRVHALSDIFHRAAASVAPAAGALEPVLRRSGISPTTIVVGPDEESEPWVRQIGSPLALECVVMTKRRRGDRNIELSLRAPTDVAGRPTLLIDDICSTGATLCAAVRALRQAGSSAVTVFVTHALCGAEAIDQIRKAGADRVISTDSCPHPTNAVPLAEVLSACLCDEVGD